MGSTTVPQRYFLSFHFSGFLSSASKEFMDQDCMFYAKEMKKGSRSAVLCRGPSLRADFRSENMPKELSASR